MLIILHMQFYFIYDTYHFKAKVISYRMMRRLFHFDKYHRDIYIWIHIYSQSVATRAQILPASSPILLATFLFNSFNVLTWYKLPKYSGPILSSVRLVDPRFRANLSNELSSAFFKSSRFTNLEICALAIICGLPKFSVKVSLATRCPSCTGRLTHALIASLPLSLQCWISNCSFDSSLSLFLPRHVSKLCKKEGFPSNHMHPILEVATTCFRGLIISEAW